MPRWLDGQIRTILRAAAGIVPILALTGCVNLEQTLTLSADGSGKYQVNYSVSEESAVSYRAMRELTKRLRETAGAAADRPGEDRHYLDWVLNPDEAAIRKTIADQAAYGLTLDKLTIESRDATRFVQLAVRFKNINTLAKAEWFRLHGFSLARQGGAWLFYRPPESGQSPIPNLTDEDEIKALTPLLRGFHVVSTFRSPGRILKATGNVEPPFSASWTFDFDRDRNALPALQNQTLQVLFECPDARFSEVRLPNHFADPKNRNSNPASTE